MPGEERGQPGPQDVLRLITDFARMMQDEEKDAAERERWLKTNVKNDELRKILTISEESQTTGRILLKLKEVLPTIIDLLDPSEIERFDQEFNVALDQISSEIVARQSRLDEINVNLK